eukprot:3000879-Rhodomonas_salina.1
MGTQIGPEILEGTSIGTESLGYTCTRISCSSATLTWIRPRPSPSLRFFPSLPPSLHLSSLPPSLPLPSLPPSLLLTHPSRCPLSSSPPSLLLSSLPPPLLFSLLSPLSLSLPLTGSRQGWGPHVARYACQG